MIDDELMSLRVNYQLQFVQDTNRKWHWYGKSIYPRINFTPGIWVEHDTYEEACRSAEKMLQELDSFTPNSLIEYNVRTFKAAHAIIKTGVQS